MCHFAVSTVLYRTSHCLKWDFLKNFWVHNLFFPQNSILLGASDEEFLNNSMSCYNFFARGCEIGLLKIFTTPLDLLAPHDACF